MIKHRGHRSWRNSGWSDKNQIDIQLYVVVYWAQVLSLMSMSRERDWSWAAPVNYNRCRNIVYRTQFLYKHKTVYMFEITLSLLSYM